MKDSFWDLIAEGIKSNDRERLFRKRTEKHISLVQKWLSKINKEFPSLSNVSGLGHDASKYEEPEYTPYVEINWDYYCKDNGIKNVVPHDMSEKMNNATIHHITSNSHHPEYWDFDFNPAMLNRENRDAVPEKMVDATSMPQHAIKEMCADWMAMSEEKGTDPLDWAKKNINKRWKFTKDQADLIYSCLAVYKG